VKGKLTPLFFMKIKKLNFHREIKQTKPYTRKDRKRKRIALCELGALSLSELAVNLNHGVHKDFHGAHKGVEKSILLMYPLRVLCAFLVSLAVKTNHGAH
jgi:hypothetical protein